MKEHPIAAFPFVKSVASSMFALELMPVKPMSGPTGILTYLDFRYPGMDTEMEMLREQEFWWPICFVRNTPW